MDERTNIHIQVFHMVVEHHGAYVRIRLKLCVKRKDSVEFYSLGWVYSDRFEACALQYRIRIELSQWRKYGIYVGELEYIEHFDAAIIEEVLQ